MNIAVRHLGEVASVDLSGSHCSISDAEKFSDTIDGIFPEQPSDANPMKVVILNLNDLSFMDCMVVGYMVDAKRKLKDKGSELYIVLDQPEESNVSEVLKTVNFDIIFQIYSSEDPILSQYAQQSCGYGCPK